jgi:hypothetical protein
MSEPLSPPRQPLTTDESWRKFRIAAALVPMGLDPALAWRLHDVGMETLDDLSTWWQTKQTSEIFGITWKTAEQIDAAVTRFWAQWEETHQRETKP